MSIARLGRNRDDRTANLTGQDKNRNEEKEDEEPVIPAEITKGECVMERKFSSRESFAQSRNPNGLSSISKVEKTRKKSAGSSGIREIQSDEFSLSRFFFPGLPEHYPLRKKIAITKANSTMGTGWDILQILLSVVACILYVADTYVSDYHGEYAFNMSETIITQFFMFDFSLNWYLDGTLSYLTQSMTIVDILTILPVYLTLITGGISTTLGFLRFVRILRLVRVFRTFKALRSLSGIKRQLLSLTLTLLSMTFLAAGLVQLMENDIQQYRYDCKYINAHTLWEPSCSQSSPADESCDCSENNCSGYYQRGNPQGKPGGIKCIRLTYFNAFYFIIVTVSTVGYGDISPSTLYSRAIVVLFIVASLVVIPMQVNRLQVLISMRSPYRNPYKAHQQETHVILCGHVNDKSKLEKFFKEFFHPDRAFSSAPEFHAVVLCPMEPTEDVRNLILSPMLDSRVTYVIGSALTVEDLKKVRADVASGMFFLCNTEVASDHASLEDAATVMRALSVSNFNPDLDCLVQVLRPEDRTILKDSDIDVILCLDEFKTALQARNAICPGFSTFVENIFHSFGAVSPSVENTLDPWYSEYLQGARMEMYYVPLDMDFLRAISFSFDRLCEAIYVEWGIVVLGLCSADQDEMTFNPTLKDLGDHKTFKSFFSVFNVALIMADDQMQAEQITRGLSDVAVVSGMLSKMDDEEELFPCCPGMSADGSHSEEHNPLRPGIMKQVPSAKLKAFATIKNNIVFGHNHHASQKFLEDSMLQRRSFSRIEEPLSDSDDDDEESYVGYVNVEKQEVVKNGRRMSSGMGAGGMVGGTSNRVRPLGLLGVRKPLSLGNSPTVENDAGRKSIRSEQRSLLARRTTAASVKEEDEEGDDDDEGAATGMSSATTVGRLSGLMTNLLSPSTMIAAPDAPKSKPKPLLRGATVGASTRANPIAIRKTLKELHEANNPSTTTTPTPAPTPSPAPSPAPHATTASDRTINSSSPSTTTEKPLGIRSLNRGSTDSAITRNRSGSDEIPGPPSGTPPSPSQMLKLTSSAPAAPLRPSQAAAEDDPVDSLMEKFGIPSAVIEDKVTVDNHIIVFGSDSSLPMFISELRRPAVKGSAYHPIVVVSPELPSKWDAIKGRYNDIYVLLGSLTRSAVFNRSNVDNAFAVILLATRDGVTTVEEENIDSTTLFAYLKLEQYIPRGVFFSVELTCASNMAVLNATIMRRARRNPGEYAKAPQTEKTITLMKSNVLSTVGARSRLGSDDDDENKIGKTESGDNIGRFTSKRNTIRQTIKDPNIARLPTNIGRRASTVENAAPAVETLQIKEPKLEVDSAETRFWDATDTHHMLPVFASARAYVPSSFESLLVQSFFGVLTPLICEKLVCGQAGQTVLQADVPMIMFGRRFLDLFRIMSYYHIICFGLYRAPATSDKAILPYVFISPSPTTSLRYQDKMFLYCKPSRLARALQAMEKRE